MFFLQEYQHVHLLWFEMWYFILVRKPNPDTASIPGSTHSRWRGEYKPGSTQKAIFEGTISCSNINNEKGC